MRAEWKEEKIIKRAKDEKKSERKLFVCWKTGKKGGKKGKKRDGVWNIQEPEAQRRKGKDGGRSGLRARAVASGWEVVPNSIKT